jgi:hypothetical protein
MLVAAMAVRMRKSKIGESDMSWRDVMKRVLPPNDGLSPEITSAGAYGAMKGRRDPASFNDRFGNWIASPDGSALLGPYQSVFPPEGLTVTSADPRNIRVLSSRIAALGGRPGTR